MKQISGYIDYYGIFYEVPHLMHDYYFMDVYREFCNNHNIDYVIDFDNTHDDFLLKKSFCKLSYDMYEDRPIVILCKELSDHQNNKLIKLFNNDKFKLLKLCL